jgi:hypothetical protein
MSFGDYLWTLVVIFFMVVYFMMLFRIIFDIFRSEDLNGWAKAGWLVFLLILPLIAMLIYVIARGGDMMKRDLSQAQQMQQAQDAYIRSVAGEGADPSTQISKAKELLDKGAITQAEFDQLKAKALA